MLMNDAARGSGMTSLRTRQRLIERLQAEGIHNQTILNVMRDIPRHLFVDEALASRAYEDIPLPIGHGQTISQPYIVARMTEALYAEGVPETVLEIGTGSGYQTAVLAHLVAKVYSVERIAALLTQARRRLRELKLTNVRLKHDDGLCGWSEYAPYPAIMLTAAPAEVPAQLLEQLALNGRLLAPVGAGRSQELVVITRTVKGYERTVLEKVTFVPMLAGVN